jgi:hypothetical protein
VHSVRLRICLAAPVLGTFYCYLLVFFVGWMSIVPRPSWWLRAFPSRFIGAMTWLVCQHTAAVVAAAVPVAVMAIAIGRERAVLLGLLSAIIATMLAVVPSMRSDIWPLIWNGHPILFVADHIKICTALPLVVWVIRRVLIRFRRIPPMPVNDAPLPTV